MGILERLGFSVSQPDLARRILGMIPVQERAGWRLDEAAGSLTHEAGAVLNLRNIFTEYRNAPRSQRAGLVQKYAQLVLTAGREPPALWDAAKRNVFPVLRSTFAETWVEIASRGNGEPHTRLALPFAGDMELRLMYDFGSTMAYVRPEHLATWNEDQASVLAHAMANLGRLEAATWQSDKRGFEQIDSPDSFGESMLLLPSVVSALPYADHAVFMPCNRGRLLACDGRNEPAWAAMLAEATRCAQEEPWPMSGMAFRQGAAGWEVAQPPASAALAAGNLLRIHEADIYASQAEALDKHLQAQGIDIFVATYSLLQSEDGALQSYCLWSEGVDSLLPVTGTVFLATPDEMQKAFRVTWGDLVEVCGELMEATSERPARFRVRAFPSEGQLQELRSRALQ